MTSRLQEVKESRFGLYVWMMPDGQIVANEDLDWLNIPSVEGDVEKIRKLRDAVRYYGIAEGQPVFLPGRRRVTDEELEEYVLISDREISLYATGALEEEHTIPKEYAEF